MRELLMDVQNISKKFPGVQALKDVCFPVYEGEIHALVGENGAGKSTLMNILSGVYEQTEGKLIWKGKEVRFKDTREPKKLGIAMIHQELSLASHLSVMENIFMGNEVVSKNKTIQWTKMYEEAVKALKMVDLPENILHLTMSELSIGNQQLVLIARGIYKKCKILILDEPTRGIDVGTKVDIQKLVLKLASEGMSVTFISSELDEMLRTCSRLVVMRDRKVVGELSGDDLNQSKVMSTIAGGDK